MEMDHELLEAFLSEGLSLEQIGKRVGKHPTTVAYWLEKHQLCAVNRDKYAPRGQLPRGTLEALVAGDATLAEIGTAVDRSTSTVRHWLARYGLRTRHGRGRRTSAEVLAAHQAGVATVSLTCARHGLTEFVLEARGYYRCRRCRSEAVVRRRRKVKEILVREAGGRCAICGYDRSLAALEFHHVDPTQKEFQLAQQGMARSLDRMRAEAQKCVLLCSNCHAEVEHGSATLPT
jgi:transposase